MNILSLYDHTLTDFFKSEEKPLHRLKSKSSKFFLETASAKHFFKLNAVFMYLIACLFSHEQECFPQAQIEKICVK